MSNIYQEKKQIQKDYYNSTAEKYDAWHTETESAKIVDQWNFENLQKFLLASHSRERSGNQQKVEKCLDIACGTGRLSAKLLQVADSVYGVDLSEEVLKIAKNKYPQINFSLGESVALPYEDNFFDLVIINGSLHHFFATEKTFAEAYRVLKTNGKFVILGEPNKNYGALWNPFFYLWLLVRVLTRILNIFVKQKTVYQELIEPEAESFVPAELKATLLKVGFEIQAFYTYDYIPRNESKLFLKNYASYLAWEHKFLSKIWPNLGSAIQFLAIKK